MSNEWTRCDACCLLPNLFKDLRDFGGATLIARYTSTRETRPKINVNNYFLFVFEVVVELVGVDDDVGEEEGEEGAGIRPSNFKRRRSPSN